MSHVPPSHGRPSQRGGNRQPGQQQPPPVAHPALPKSAIEALHDIQEAVGQPHEIFGGASSPVEEDVRFRGAFRRLLAPVHDMYPNAPGGLTRSSCMDAPISEVIGEVMDVSKSLRAAVTSMSAGRALNAPAVNVRLPQEYADAVYKLRDRMGLEWTDLRVASTEDEVAEKFRETAQDTLNEVHLRYPLPDVPALRVDCLTASYDQIKDHLEKVGECIGSVGLQEVGVGPTSPSDARTDEEIHTGVKINDAAGVIIGDDGVITLRRNYKVLRPTVDRSELIDYYLNHMGAGSVRCASPVGPMPVADIAESYKGVVPDSVQPEVRNSPGVMTGDHARATVDDRYVVRGPDLSPAALLGDQAFRELFVRSLIGENETEEEVSDREEAAAQLPAALRAAIGRISPETLLIDFTPVVMPEPATIRSVSGVLCIQSGMGVAVGTGNSILEEYRFKLAGRPILRDE